MVLRYTKVLLVLGAIGLYLPNTHAQNAPKQAQEEQLYPQVVLSELLAAEKERMDSLRAKYVEPDHIASWRKISIAGKYLHQKRPIQTTTITAASFSCRIYTGNTELLRFFTDEYLFEIEGKPYWLPVSKTKAAQLKQVARKGEDGLHLFGIFASRPNPHGALAFTMLVEQFALLPQ